MPQILQSPPRVMEASPYGTRASASSCGSSMGTQTGSGDGQCRLWDVTNGELLHELTPNGGVVRAIDADWAKMRAATGTYDGIVRIWDLERGVCTETFECNA